MSGHAYTAAAMPRRTAPARAGWAAAARALGIAGLCLLALTLVWVVAELVPAAQVKDAVALRHFTLLSGPHVDAAANFLLHLVDPLLLIFWAGGLVLFALARGKTREALAAVCVITLAPITADRLKPLLAHHHASAGTIHIGPASWPSGHSTAAMAVALCAVLVAPPRARPFVAVLGLLFAVAVGCALLVRAWHMPSDVVGGYLMAALWTALAVAALRGAEWRWPRVREPGA